MTVEAFCLGSLDTNAFLVSDEASGRAWVFDCPDHPQALIASLHGLEDRRRAFPGVPVHQHPAEVTWLSDPVANLSSWMGAPVTAAPAEVLVDEGQTLHVGPWTAQVFHVPGHSPGSVAYWFENEGELFSGDGFVSVGGGAVGLSRLVPGSPPV
jgi:hydroxyacylglutathione hydrolase